MLNSQKILWFVFIVLFVVAISEIFYIFYYKKPVPKAPSVSIPAPTLFVESNKPTQTPIPTVSIKSRNAVGLPFIFNEKFASTSGEQVREFISEAKKKKLGFVSYTNFLKAVIGDSKNCNEQKNCFQSDNFLENINWKSNTDKDFPISISGFFVVRLNISGNKGQAGILLTGRTSKNIDNYWEDLRETFIGVYDNGKRLYIDAKNSGPIPSLLFSKTFDKKIEGVYILFNETGTTLLVTDLAFNNIAFVDVNKNTDNKFPEGLFPDKQFYIGYGIAPLSDLKVYDFSIL